MLQTSIYNFSPFGGTIYLGYGDLESFVRYCKPRVTESTRKDLDSIVTYTDKAGFTIIDNNVCIIYLYPNQTYEELISTLSHEILHSIFAITNYSGNQYSQKGEELYCYYMSDILQYFMKSLNLKRHEEKAPDIINTRKVENK